MKQILLFLTTLLLSCCSSDNVIKAQNMDKMYITIGDQTQSITLADNDATRTLIEKLPVTVTLNSSGDFEIWGPLGFSLPTSNQQITAQPGDVVLYNGSNSWSYTPLGKIEGLSESQLRTFLKAGESNISVTLSLSSGTTAIGSLTSNPSPKGEGNIYSLDGRQVSNPSKGIYIKNGKKVIL